MNEDRLKDSIALITEGFDALHDIVTELDRKQEHMRKHLRTAVNYEVERRISRYERKWATKIAFLNANVSQELYGEE